jgi:hypothetical protein
MRVNVNVRTICSTFSVVALLMGISECAFSQSAGVTPRTEKAAGSDARKSYVKPGDEKGAKKPFANLDADLNDDGIIDAVATLTTVKAATASESKQSTSEFQENLTAAFRDTPRIQRPSPRSSCMDYLLLSPEEQARVIQKVQTRTVAVFGTRPCEPFVSPHLERPFDTNYAEIPFFPFPGVSIILRD